MTDGMVAILGSTGRNFGAGMSGGVAYVFDPHDDFAGRCNAEMVVAARSLSLESAGLLRRMIERHRDATGSVRAAEILEHWEAFLRDFWKISPREPAAVSALPGPAWRSAATRRASRAGRPRAVAVAGLSRARLL
jgi:glutamate synthase domain-containing protein 3